MDAIQQWFSMLFYYLYAIVALTVPPVVCFLAWLFQETIREGLLWRLKTKRELSNKRTELERLFTPGEQEALKTMAKTGKPLRMDRSKPPQVYKLSLMVGEVCLQIATQKDVFGLSDRKFIEKQGNQSYKLSERGSTKGEELLILYG